MVIGEAGVPKQNVILAEARQPAPGNGTHENGNGSRSTNLILAGLAEDEYGWLQPHLEPVELAQRDILHEQARDITHVYFPQDGMVSLVVMAKDGRSVEVNVVGREGAVGLSRLAGMMEAPYRAISQIPGHALRVQVDALENVLRSTKGLQVAFGRYILMQGLQMAQTAACNRLHEIDQRLARWLLMCQDRVDKDKLLLTHEFLAQMLGAGRPSVSLAAGVLQRAGLIDNLRGAIRILDRPGLQESACECYRVMQDFNSELGLAQSL
jgi:CRP-like cAMP-binding protein